MARTLFILVAWISVVPRSCRLDFVVFLVRMWRLNACERLIEPEPRGLKRLAAPLLVFIFGMAESFRYMTAAGGETVSHFEPEIGLFASFLVPERRAP